MKALALAALAALGNTLYAWAQQRAGATAGNPFWFGAAALAVAALLMAGLALLPLRSASADALHVEVPWVVVAAFGYVLLFAGLYFLYRHFGTGHYALYASLAILSTALLLPWLLDGESPGVRQWLACATALLTLLLLTGGPSPR